MRPAEETMTMKTTMRVARTVIMATAAAIIIIAILMIVDVFGQLLERL